MSIGRRILEARQELGLSQRELAGENITRNMLSALEHDKAKPSLDTLCYLSQALHKPVGYFLEEEAPPPTDGYELLCQARRRCDAGDNRGCLELLRKIPEGEVLAREAAMMKTHALIALVEQAISAGRLPYARELAEQARKSAKRCPYLRKEAEEKIALLRAKAANRPGQLGKLLGDIQEDGALMLKARFALEEKRYLDARRYLEAVDDRDGSWDFALAEALYGLGEYAQAAERYLAAEKTMGKAVHRRLGLCYAAMKDFENAYRWASMAEGENG